MMNRRFLADANELCRFGVGELTAGFSSGKFTPLEVAQATLARAEQVQERFNAFSLIDADAALAAAKQSTARWQRGSPLSGIDGLPDDQGYRVGEKLGREVRQSHDIHHPMHSGRAVSEAAQGRRRSFDRAYDNPRVRLESDHRQPFDRGHSKSLES
jgi:hypothetical protein